ncbi:NAD-dependent epimerase/dehydratase family protein [Chitinibacteraceae bacterium HSL-7]
MVHAAAQARSARLLIVGCGDVMRRALPFLLQRFRVFVTCRSAESAAQLRQLGAVPVRCDLDHFRSLKRIAGLACHVIYSAPPADRTDQRLRRTVAALVHKRASLPLARLVYIGTTGVYGNLEGRWADETHPVHAGTERAHRRLAAEQQVRRLSKTAKTIRLRAPGIYAEDRLPVERLQRGDPVICSGEDSYSNHIHAHDLARIAALALWRGQGGGRVYNCCDHAPIGMGDWFDAVADATRLARPERLSRTEVLTRVSPAMASYLEESRRLHNHRLQELRIRLVYPDARAFLRTLS